MIVLFSRLMSGTTSVFGDLGNLVAVVAQSLSVQMYAFSDCHICCEVTVYQGDRIRLIQYYTQCVSVSPSPFLSTFSQGKVVQ